MNPWIWVVALLGAVVLILALVGWAIVQGQLRALRDAPPVSHYSEEMGVGDILLTRPYDTITHIQAILARSAFIHSMIVITEPGEPDHPLALSAGWDGVSLVPVQSGWYWLPIDRVRLPSTTERHILITDMTSRRFERWLPNLAKSLLPRRRTLSDHLDPTLFCSQAVVLSLQRLGLLELDVDAERMHPKDLLSLPILRFPGGPLRLA